MALSARRIKTNPVRLVISDKSCQHYMNKSLRGQCAHTLHVILCLCESPSQDVAFTGKTFHCQFVSVVVYKTPISFYIQSCAVLLQHPSEQNVQYLGGLMKPESTSVGEPSAKCHIKIRARVGYNRLLSNALNKILEKIHFQAYE